MRRLGDPRILGGALAPANRGHAAGGPQPMMGGRAAGPTTVEALAWDSEHLGIPVARLTAPDLEPAALRQAIEMARAGRFRLVYWPAAAGRDAPESILRDFNGLLVDRK